jgi:hypothetical protein
MGPDLLLQEPAAGRMVGSCDIVPHRTLPGRRGSHARHPPVRRMSLPSRIDPAAVAEQAAHDLVEDSCDRAEAVDDARAAACQRSTA